MKYSTVNIFNSCGKYFLWRRVTKSVFGHVAMRRLAFSLFPLFALSACGNKAVGDSDVKAAVATLVEATSAYCFTEKGRSDFPAITLVNVSVNGRSCNDQSCTVDTKIEVRFTPDAGQIKLGVNCGIDLGQNWSMPGLSRWLVKGQGVSVNPEWRQSGRYASSEPLVLRADLSFSKFDTGWRFEGAR